MAASQFKSKMAMSLASASRFAVLKIEDDEDERGEVAKNKQSKAKQEEFQVVAKKKPKKKKPDDKDTAELQSLAFSSNKQVKKKQPSKSSLNNTKKPVGEGQWQEWIKKDSEFVTDSYEQDLQQAILLSKLDYEEKKEVYDCVRQDDAKGAKNSKKNSKKKEKPSTLSLDQFNSMAADQLGNASKENKIGSSNSHLTTIKPTAEDEHFFEKVASDAEKILHKEQRFEAFKQLEPNITPSARTLQFQDEIEKRDKEIEQLKLEVESLKAELLTVKTRNKKLCNILAQGEMREKAEILVQVEQLTKIKDELTEQVTELHGSLEQERSKVHALQTDSKKYQGNRKESK